MKTSGQKTLENIFLNIAVVNLEKDKSLADYEDTLTQVLVDIVNKSDEHLNVVMRAFAAALITLTPSMPSLDNVKEKS